MFYLLCCALLIPVLEAGVTSAVLMLSFAVNLFDIGLNIFVNILSVDLFYYGNKSSLKSGVFRDLQVLDLARASL